MLTATLVTLLLALVCDWVLGDPPNALHPVAWMGHGIGLGRRLAPTRSPALAFLAGALLMLVGLAVVLFLGLLIATLCDLLPRPWSWLVEAVVLKTTLAWRGLMRAALDVHDALVAGDLVAARRWLSWHLVSRDTSTLTESQVAAATVESVAENASDGVIAPLLFYLIGGLPLALAYRFINTADAMLGYRDPAREWLGKVPARLDDLVNLIPARCTAALFFLATWALGGHLQRAGAIWLRDARQTASPNAGHPMSMMAGALGVQLEKVEHYSLGTGQALPRASDILSATHLLTWAVGLGVGVLLLVSGIMWLW